MKKILLSLVTIGAVAGLAIGASRAFFSDVETSTGNTFTAGELDLRFQVEGQSAQWTDVSGSPLFDGVTFPLADLKPGDSDEKTVRLWVDDNPSCGQISVNITEDLDNTCTEPEIDDETGCATNPTGTDAGSGELNDQINFAVWLDDGAGGGTACNNIMDGIESPLVSGPIADTKAYSIGELPILEANAKCYGVAYCFGTWNGTTCNGSSVNNVAQTDSFKADLIINALQKRNLFDAGCPIGEMQSQNLENKDSGWQIMGNDDIYGTISYSTGAHTFFGVVKGQGLVSNAKYQITLNGPGTCMTTDNNLAHFGANLFQSGYWNNWAPNLSNTCIGSPGEGIYNMNLISDWYTFESGSNGKFEYPFNLNLPVGTYTGVKVLVKKMLDPYISPWVDSSYEHVNNLFEVAPITFSVI